MVSSRQSSSILRTLFVSATLVIAGCIHGQPNTTPNAPTVLSGKVRRAMKQLEGLDTLYSAQYGMTMHISPQVKAWRVISREVEAGDAFDQLVKSDHLGTRMYALAGLYLWGRDTYEYEAAKLRTRSDSMPVVIADVAFMEAISTVVERIDRGTWSLEFATGALLPYR